VLACILAFYPGEKFEDVCSAIAEEVSYLLIVDNSPDSILLRDEIWLPKNSSIIYNKNEGAVAGALNIALTLARERGFEYLQIFDQDTMLPAGITSALVDTLKFNPKAVLVSPRFINLNTNHPGRVMTYISKWKIKNIWPNTDIGIVQALFTITSASLINLKLLPQDLYYDERLIIDGCDVDFCLALRDKQLQIIVNTSQCIIHGIGNRKNGGGRWSPTNYSPQRKFLGAKNRVIVWRRYLKKYPGFIINDCYVFFLDTVRTVLLEKDKINKLKAIIMGVFAGAREKNILIRKHNNRIECISDKTFEKEKTVILLKGDYVGKQSKAKRTHSDS